MSTTITRRDRFEALAGEVFEPLQRYLHRRLGPDDAQDVFGEVMLTLWRRLDDVPVANPLPWCYGVARMTMSNFRRSRARHLRLVQKMAQEPGASHVEGPDHDTTDPELTEALSKLAESEREVLRLWAWEGLEAKEIASALGLTVNAATLRLSRARKKLQTELRQNSHVPGHEIDKHTEVASDE